MTNMFFKYSMHCFSISPFTNSSLKEKFAAEIEIMRLKDELQKIKQNHKVKVSQLKLKIQEQKEENELLTTELQKYRDGEEKLSVSLYSRKWQLHPNNHIICFWFCDNLC